MKKISSVVSLSFLVLFLLIGCGKKSNDWVEYKTDENGVFSYKKINTDKNYGNYIVQVWVKQVYSDKGKEKIIQMTVKNRESTEGYEKLSQKIMLTEHDCKKHMVSLLSLNYYDSDGKVLPSHDFQNLWKYIISDSPDDVLHKIVCK